MQTVQPIYEGESYASIFQKLNTLIAGYNEMVQALGSALNNGTFDYNSLSNRPSINNVLLEGNKTQDQLSISIDSETQQALTQFGTQIEGINTSLAGKVNTNDLPTVLQPYAKSTDIPDVSGLATKTELNNGLAGKVDSTTFSTTVTSLNTSINSKASAGEVPTLVQWNTLNTEMTAKVTQAGNSATAAANSATTASNKATEASQSASSVSGAIGRISALETTVGNSNSGLVYRATQLETKVGQPGESGKPGTGLYLSVEEVAEKVGSVGEKVSITADLKETREKTNTVLTALKEFSPEMYEKVKDIAALDVNY